MERACIAKEVYVPYIYGNGFPEGLGQKELIALVRRQINEWLLTPGKLSKANKTDLKSKLLDPKYGFTTDKPAIPGTDLVPGGSTAGPSATIATAPTVDNPGPVEPSPTQENGGTVVVPREIRLLIDDRRASYPIHTMQRVQVRFVDTADCGENQWRADASEILLALQKSISSITGSAKIGTPDRLNSSYPEYFVEIIANQPVETLAVSPELVVISENNQLTLRVDAQSLVGCSTSKLGLKRFHLRPREFPRELLSRSALLDATQMIEIIDRYTVECSDNYSDEVTDEITKSNENIPKAATLKAFLTGWDCQFEYEIYGIVQVTYRTRLYSSEYEVNVRDSSTSVETLTVIQPELTRRVFAKLTRVLKVSIAHRSPWGESFLKPSKGV
ncbi:hypothetical protein B0H16DRAFT_1461738 [Mycena metata]|uniref:Uncharacterized protein n=1 Tax=Mycena metata TaxID=1033252 RepID=A0AAD7ISQ7_9AGAR|nr:hypothetical protein B0H16DRAFT_1461738 [Mycena metata]